MESLRLGALKGLGESSWGPQEGPAGTGILRKCALRGSLLWKLSESAGKDWLGAGSLELLKAASKMLRSLH